MTDARRKMIALVTLLAMLFAIVATVLASRASAIIELSDGPTGEIVSITPLSPDWAHPDTTNFHGKLTIRAEGEDPAELIYTWGGSRCNNRDMTDVQVHILMDLYRDGRFHITPHWRSGLGSTRCILGFTPVRLPGLLDPVQEVIDSIDIGG